MKNNFFYVLCEVNLCQNYVFDSVDGTIVWLGNTNLTV